MTIAKKVEEFKKKVGSLILSDRNCGDLEYRYLAQFKEIVAIHETSLREVEEEAKKEVLDEVRKETFRVEGTSYGCMKHYGTEPDTCKGCLNANTRNEERKSVAERIRTFCQSLKS